MAGASIDRYVELLLLLSFGLVAWMVLRGRPVLGLVGWCVVAGFVPFWLGVTFVVYFQPLSAVGLLIIAATLGQVKPRLGWPDGAVALMLAACVLPGLIGLGTVSSVFTAVFGWGVAFTVGRLLPVMVGLGRVYVVVGTTAAVVGVCAVLEFAAGWNPFSRLGIGGGGLYAFWSELQVRGGLVRAEWAYGHSIALGACLALAVPLLLAAPLRWTTRLLLLAPVLAGAVVTFSRIGLLCSVLGLVLSVLFLPNELSNRLRVAVSLGMGGAAVLVAPFVLGVFASAGSEATNSAAYRGNLSSLIPSISPLGFSPAAQRTGSGELFFGQFRSIDSALILLGLTYGWMALALAAFLLAAAGLAVLLRKGNPAMVAIVAHVPALLTVALITQYGMFFWFVAGIAVCAAVERRPGDDPDMALTPRPELTRIPRVERSRR